MLTHYMDIKMKLTDKEKQRRSRAARAGDNNKELRKFMPIKDKERLAIIIDCYLLLSTAAKTRAIQAFKKAVTI